jgi:hypothetical protein
MADPAAGKARAPAVPAAPAAPRSGTTTAPSDHPALGVLVQRCVDAYGGKKALARAASVRQEGRVTSLLHPGATGRILRAYERPGRLRVEIAWPGDEPEVRILDGSRGWRNGEAVESARLASMLLQAARLDLPALISAWQAKLRDLGSTEVDGKTLRVVSLQPAPGILVEAAIEERTGLIVRSRGTSRDARMPLEFITSYGDFRKVDGLLVPFHEDNWANGRSTGETTLERVELVPLPRGTFQP